MPEGLHTAKLTSIVVAASGPLTAARSPSREGASAWAGVIKECRRLDWNRNVDSGHSAAARRRGQ
jgi:hypothetical protein